MSAELVSHNEQRLREQVVEIARQMSALRLVSGTLGNVSARLVDALVITPTRTRYEDLEPSDLPVVGFDGETRSGALEPSRELALHLGIYRARPDVRAIVHTHSVFATAWSFLALPLEPRLEELDYEAIGAIRTSAPADAGSAELAERGVATLGGSRAVLLGGHGVVTVGADLRAALTAAEMVERQAHVCWLLRSQAQRLAP
jgi:L-fuculose-phosphate aldolase